MPLAYLLAWARSLGATSWHAFRRVTLPLALRGVLTGAVLVYARSGRPGGVDGAVVATRPGAGPGRGW